MLGHQCSPVSIWAGCPSCQTRKAKPTADLASRNQRGHGPHNQGIRRASRG
ncbi:conserved domain protein [Roseibium sp. TrichSKD4]|nr:conserved domain protein [Roseibium sp. TrichSKD4]